MVTKYIIFKETDPSIKANGDVIKARKSRYGTITISIGIIRNDP